MLITPEQREAIEKFHQQLKEEKNKPISGLEEMLQKFRKQPRNRGAKSCSKTSLQTIEEVEISPQIYGR